MQKLETRVTQACTDTGRNPADVRVLAVSKRQPTSAIRAAYALGLRDFGENYAQELVSKAAELTDLPGLRWHMIGHLQRNKVRQLAPTIHTLHTLDSEKLIGEVQRRANVAGRQINVFIQVNVGREAQKSGCAPAQLSTLVALVDQAPNLIGQGLMMIPPHPSDPSAARSHFNQLRELKARHAPTWPRLSMGMSADLESAIREGATDIRVGTALFGPRP